jgi:hypothetical protein
VRGLSPHRDQKKLFRDAKAVLKVGGDPAIISNELRTNNFLCVGAGFFGVEFLCCDRDTSVACQNNKKNPHGEPLGYG